MPRDRTDAGTFVETVTLDAVLEVFDEVRGPVITSSDVAEHLECTTEAARQKLTRLYDQGKVDKRKTGRTVVWWQTKSDELDAGDLQGDADTTLSDLEDTVGESQEARDTPSADGVGSEGEASGAPSPPASDDQDAEERLRELTLPGTGGKLDARIDAVLQLYASLKDHAGEPVTRGDLLEHVDPDAVGYASRESFWNNFVKANSPQGRETNALVALPGVEEWGDGEYRYTKS